MRVFQDRLISIEDRDTFTDMVKEIVKDKFKKEWSSLVKVEPLLFGSFVPLVYPENDTTKKPYQDVYCELNDREKVKKYANEGLGDYNQAFP